MVSFKVINYFTNKQRLEKSPKRLNKFPAFIILQPLSFILWPFGEVGNHWTKLTVHREVTSSSTSSSGTVKYCLHKAASVLTIMILDIIIHQSQGTYYCRMNTFTFLHSAANTCVLLLLLDCECRTFTCNGVIVHCWICLFTKVMDLSTSINTGLCPHTHIPTPLPKLLQSQLLIDGLLPRD